MPVFNQSFEDSLHRALALANEHQHEYATLEHLLSSLLEDAEVVNALERLDIDIEDLRFVIKNYIDHELNNIFSQGSDDAKPTAGFQRVVQRAHIRIQSAGKDEIEPLDALTSILLEKDSYAAGLLNEYGVERNEIEAARSSPGVAYVEFSQSQAKRRLKRIIPLQAPAPVRVEERGGKIVRYSERQSALFAAESDFLRWRQPVLDHIRELISSDFHSGTNHSRIRSRLLSLDLQLAGTVQEIKEQQFTLGYDIERLGGILSVYNSGSEDVPSINAWVLEELTRLQISLAMGIEKLESWSAFKQAAFRNDILAEAAKLEIVANALDDFATQMHKMPEYFDQELPATFRYLAAAARDPEQAETVVMNGGVKSAENLLSFLAQKSLGAAKSVGDNVEKYISGAVAASLVGILANSASSISGALPAGWAWLKPLLEFLSRISAH